MHFIKWNSCEMHTLITFYLNFHSSKKFLIASHRFFHLISIEKCTNSFAIISLCRNFKIIADRRKVYFSTVPNGHKIDANSVIFLHRPNTAPVLLRY